MHVNRTVADEHSTNVIPLDGMNDSAGEHRERRRVIIVIKGEWILHGTRGYDEGKEKERGRKVVETMTGDTYSSITGWN